MIGMLLPYLFVGVAVVLVVWIVAMVAAPSTVEDEVERELTRIRRQMYRGWSDERIARHHPEFCICEIHHLRLVTFGIRTDGAGSRR